MERAFFDDATKRIMALLPLTAAISGVLGAAVYYIIRRSQVITLQHFGLDSGLVSTPVAEMIADGLSSVLIVVIVIAVTSRLATWPIKIGKSALLKIPIVRRFIARFHADLEERPAKALPVVATLFMLALAVTMVFTPAALAAWQVGRINWLIDANLCQHYCFTYRLSAKERSVIGLPIAVGSSRLVVIGSKDRAHLLDAQSIRATEPFKGEGQKAFSRAPLRMRVMWIALDLMNGNFKGLLSRF